LENGSAVSIVPVSRDGEIYLIGQHRYATGAYSWEIPSGAHEGGDDLDNAKRELREETGLVSENWTRLAAVHVMNGTANFKMIVFLAEHVRETGEHAQLEEGITGMRKESFQRAFDMIRSGEMTDSESISAITLAALHHRIF
jgi:8-oxo-dGTP pyrophosphatase MutT (NUDIX family)